jgi:hypothetical protein
VKLRTAPNIERRIEQPFSNPLGIVSFDEKNDYPQALMNIIQESPTALSCLDIYGKFLYGDGFPDEISSLYVNSHGQDLNAVLRLCVKDYAMFGGFYLHVNYNYFLEVCEIQHVPFETVRFAKIDKTARNVTSIKTHWDWTGQFGRFDDKLIEEFFIFNPNKEVVLAQIKSNDQSHDVEDYAGQILFVSDDVALTYPIGKFDAVIPDMITEAKLGTVRFRNVASNFFPAGMVVFTEQQAENDASNDDEDNDKTYYEKRILELQGADNLGKIMSVTKRPGESDPTFINFSGENYDKAFTVTDETCRQSIRRRLNIPPILSGEDVSQGFATDVMEQAYNAYSKSTTDDRRVIEDGFKRLLGNTSNVIDLGAVHIKPLTYTSAEDVSGIPAVSFGVGGTQAMISLLSDENLTDVQKINTLSVWFGLSEEDAKRLLSRTIESQNKLQPSDKTNFIKRIINIFRK